MKLPYEWRIGWRYTRAGRRARKNGFISFISGVSVIGIALGVASGTVMGPSRHLTGAFTVLFLGMPASRLTSVSLQNSTNCPGMRIVPSQVLLLLLAP